MTVASYAIGTPPISTQRGGDCRAVDLAQGRTVVGPHGFATTADAQITNGLIRLTLGALGSTPIALTVESYRGPVTVGDVYVDTYADLYPGSLSTREWIAMGAIVFDSPSVASYLNGVQLVRVNEETITLRIVSSAIGDAFVTLHQGERMVHVQHGTTRPPLVTTTRRIRLTASPSLVGTASTGLVQEVTPAIDGFARFVSAIDTVTADAGAFSLTTGSVTYARFAAGIGTSTAGDGAEDMHRQMGNTSRKLLVLSAA